MLLMTAVARLPIVSIPPAEHGGVATQPSRFNFRMRAPKSQSAETEIAFGGRLQRRHSTGLRILEAPLKDPTPRRLWK